MREGLKKKRKSIIHTIHADTKWKNFKSIVESKIMSKSNMALESEELEATTKQGLIRKRTCEGRFHGSDAGDSPSSLNPKDLVDKDTLTEKSATVEEPNTGTLLNAGDMEDTRLSKGKSMPSLRYYGLKS